MEQNRRQKWIIRGGKAKLITNELVWVVAIYPLASTGDEYATVYKVGKQREYNDPLVLVNIEDLYHPDALDFDLSLQQDLCLGCGQVAPEGIFGAIVHSCPLNTHTYNPSGSGEYKVLHGMGFMRMFDLLLGKDDLQTLKELVTSDSLRHFNAMVIDQSTTWVDMNNYRLAREFEVRAMQRIRAYMEIEKYL